MKKLLRTAAYGLTAKRLTIEPEHLVGENARWFNLSTNAILSFRKDGRLYYFRPCYGTGGSKKYLWQAVADFFESLKNLGIEETHFMQNIPISLTFSDVEIETFFGEIHSKMSDRRFRKKLLKADRVWESCRRSIWDGTGDYTPVSAAFGLEQYGDLAVYFLWCIRGAAMSYPYRRIVSRGGFAAVRSAASMELAAALGLEKRITACRFCVLDGRLGLLSQAAEGSRVADIKPKPTGALQRQLLELNVLDVLAYQPDHGPNNYNFSEEYGICAFDNDNPQTFFPDPRISATFAGCAPLTDKDGLIARPYFDRALAEKILGLDLFALKKRMKPYLNGLQRWALGCRVKALQNAIEKTQNTHPEIFIACDCWDGETLARELSGSWGMTYLHKALQ